MARPSPPTAPSISRPTSRPSRNGEHLRRAVRPLWGGHVNTTLKAGGVPTPLNTGWDFTCGDYRNPNQNELSWFENSRLPNGRPACYTQRTPFTFRTLPARHGNITDPTAVQVNMAIAKKITVTERWSVELRGEAFNAFNTPIRQGPNTDPNSNQFGILPVAQYNFPRNIQLGARIRF